MMYEYVYTEKFALCMWAGTVLQKSVLNFCLSVYLMPCQPTLVITRPVLNTISEVE